MLQKRLFASSDPAIRSLGLLLLIVPEKPADYGKIWHGSQSTDGSYEKRDQKDPTQHIYVHHIECDEGMTDSNDQDGEKTKEERPEHA